MAFIISIPQMLVLLVDTVGNNDVTIFSGLISITNLITFVGDGISYLEVKVELVFLCLFRFVSRPSFIRLYFNLLSHLSILRRKKDR